MAEDKASTRVRITNQFRSREAMVYDLSCETTRLTVQIAPRPNDDGLGDWSAEAHARQSPERPSVGELGATRGDALRAVARSWTAKNGAYGFPALDWELVAQALIAVRAI
jgi:hypothetical protein